MNMMVDVAGTQVGWSRWCSPARVLAGCASARAPRAGGGPRAARGARRGGAPARRRRADAGQAAARRRERRQARLLHRAARRHADPHRPGHGQNWRDIVALEQHRQPEPDRSRPGAARRAARRRSAAASAPRRCTAARSRPAADARPGAAPAAASAAPRRRRAARRAGTGAAPRRRPASRRSARGRRRRHWAWPRRRPRGRRLRRGKNKGLDIARQGRRSGAGRGRRPGGLCRRGPARLRQPDHPEAQQHLPHGLRAQPDAAGEGRPDRAQGPEDRRDGLQRRRPREAALRDPPAGQAGRSGAPAAARAMDAHVAGPRLRHRDDSGRRQGCALRGAPTRSPSDARCRMRRAIADRAGAQQERLHAAAPAARAGRSAACSAAPRGCACTPSSTATTPSERQGRSRPSSTRVDKHAPQLVSWNGGGFDLPVLHYRGAAATACVADKLLGHGRATTASSSGTTTSAATTCATST